MKGLWWPSTQEALSDKRDAQISMANSAVSIRQQIMAALLTGGMVLALYALYRWSALLLLISVCAVTSIVIVRLLLNSTSPTARPTDMPIGRDTRTLVRIPITLQPPALDFPETPMPSGPLVRVLETIDLSSSDVEHFIKASSEDQPAQVAATREYSSQDR